MKAILVKSPGDASQLCLGDATTPSPYATISYGFNGLRNQSGRIRTAWYYKFRFNQ